MVLRQSLFFLFLWQCQGYQVTERDKAIGHLAAEAEVFTFCPDKISAIACMLHDRFRQRQACEFQLGLRDVSSRMTSLGKPDESIQNFSLALGEAGDFVTNGNASNCVEELVCLC